MFASNFSAFLSITYDLFRIVMIALDPFGFLIYVSVLFGILMNSSGLLGLIEKCLDYLQCTLKSFLGSSVMFFPAAVLTAVASFSGCFILGRKSDTLDGTSVWDETWFSFRTDLAAHPDESTADLRR